MQTPTYGQYQGPISSGDYFELSWEMFGELCRALALRVARITTPSSSLGSPERG